MQSMIICNQTNNTSYYHVGAVLGAEAFDTHGEASAGENLRGYLNSINGDKIVLVAIQDEGSKYVPVAMEALKRLGAADSISTDFRGSFCLVGYAGDTKQKWITQQEKNGGKGPTEVSVQILFSPGPSVGIRLRSEGCDDADKKTRDLWNSLHLCKWGRQVTSRQGPQCCCCCEGFNRYSPVQGSDDQFKGE